VIWDIDQLARYLAVGGVVTFVDLVAYSFLTGRSRALPRIAANMIAVTVGMGLGFALHFALVFHPPDARVPLRLARYLVTVGASVYGVQNLVIYALDGWWPSPARVAQGVVRRFDRVGRYSDDLIDRMTGKVAATLVGMVWNFLFFKYFVYA